MMVTFVSECQKNAIKKTRRVLDSFADRIGANVWQTVITHEGLDAVKKLLRKTASRNTAVACHWLRSRSRFDLYWIVGNRLKFNSQGRVPVHSTQQDLLNIELENDWHYLPLIKSLTALACLFHDWGKANDAFQKKLRKGNKTGDPLRHEWVSCLLLQAFIECSGAEADDEKWLTRLATGKIPEAEIISKVSSSVKISKLPPLATLLAWLIVSHHRLPILPKEQAKQYRNNSFANYRNIFNIISAGWGYQNNDTVKLGFNKGLLTNCHNWRSQLAKWAEKTQNCLPLLFNECLQENSWRLILHHARLAMMLGDHYFSSRDLDKKYKSSCQLFANTDQKHKGEMKQQLDEHLLGVTKSALPIVHLLPRIENHFPSVSIDRGHALNKRSTDKKFIWQNKLVDKVSDCQKQQTDNNRQGLFAVNMASTGTGKTFANAKLMQALSKDQLSSRYTLALGLRTLTLQTGDEYRQRIGLKKDNVAVIIGSQTIKDLHGNRDSSQKILQADDNDSGSESQTEIWDGQLDFAENSYIEDEFLKKLFNDQDPRQEKHKTLLYAPILICTIDHIMSATETIRGGRYILPSLRLMSGDLVIDEIDDFTGSDLIAIGRLIHLTGMLGRRVIISSATIPPDLACGYFNAYQCGWQLFHKTRANSSAKISCLWIDEFNTQINTSDCEIYQKQHDKFVSKRISKLHNQPVRRRGKIICCDDLKTVTGEINKQDGYFAKIMTTICQLHNSHHCQDPKTNKKVSFGVVRMANIDPCIELTKFLLESNWPEQFDVRVMAYHSRQVLLLRSEQEKHLDAVLKNRKLSFENKIIRQHLDNSRADNVIFILVATPVEEVGRDHDFDWAVIEPSSFRSIIQLAGRVLRHRDCEVTEANIALMQYNLKGLTSDKVVFCNPGFESKRHKLQTHDLTNLLDEKKLAERIDASPRIVKPAKLRPEQRLADLEHAVIDFLLRNTNSLGPETLHGYLNNCWGLTALPQLFKPFRAGANGIKLYLRYEEHKFCFCEKVRNEFIPREDFYRVSYQPKNLCPARQWLVRDYYRSLTEIAEQKNLTKQQASEIYGELVLPKYLLDNRTEYFYDDQLGLK